MAHQAHDHNEQYVDLTEGVGFRLFDRPINSMGVAYTYGKFFFESCTKTVIYPTVALATGATIGTLEGLTRGERGSFKIRLNSVLNAVGKRSIRLANMTAVACSYTELICRVFYFSFLPHLTSALLPCLRGCLQFCLRHRE